MKIYGAGLAGLLAGTIFPQAQIFEARPEGEQQHKALLRFRSRAVGDAVGIDFKHVLVHKAIWIDGVEVGECSPRLANLYSKKVAGLVLDRSIWNLAPAERWIAPDNLLEQLADRCAGRVEWNRSVETEDLFESSFNKFPSISTIPMPIIGQLLKVKMRDFARKRIHVQRERIAGADVYQTIYYPGPETHVYRASITGDTLIIESTQSVDGSDVAKVLASFGLKTSECSTIDKNMQEYGKLTPVDDQWRRQFIFELSQKHGIFSLGRFGTWRNIMMDDVLDDIFVIKKLMNAGSYKNLLASTK